MKKISLIVLLATLPMLSFAQLDLSLRDTRFASIGYTLKIIGYSVWKVVCLVQMSLIKMEGCMSAIQMR